ncbi:1-deoxy-D-xylulose-5-phosphate synthase [Sphaerisporangium viridialbum]|uniref:1-deoxy-D-xylulose-5-phosphate synthase n=1 Tax=Sphaerisporangium viridialbum TaxID=46189 RepID=UPI003C7459ED
MSLLEGITEPGDLGGLDSEELGRLAWEIREFLVGAVSRSGGHLGSNLGAVELTIAVHRVFRSPADRILFDTGHQTYVHKLLTGRREGFARLRTRDGLSGYPNRSESVHDIIENSHASTALSYADGFAKAHTLSGEDDRHVVVVVGDGALTGGMAWEALNNIGAARNRPVVIVLNDNGRSYCPTAGGIARRLAELRDKPAGEGGNIFEELGIAYLGPVDGHDEPAVEEALRHARDLRAPVVVHCVTSKGYGYTPAETDPVERLHSPGPFDPGTGVQLPRPGATWTRTFADTLVALGGERPDIVAITAAMLHPAGLAPFAERYPDRTYDVGIAEQHAVASAAGLASAGFHPVVAIYSTFLNRAFDQLLMDVALHGLPVTFVLDRAGVTGDDGPSHNGMWDLSLLQMVPRLRIAAPRDASRLGELLRQAVEHAQGPTVVRFPKGPAGDDIPAVGAVGTLDVLHHVKGEDVLLVSCGAMAGVCVAAAHALREAGLAVTVVDPRWVAPLDESLAELAARHRFTAVVEDNCRVGGVGDGVARLLRDHGVERPVRTYGIPQGFAGHARRAELLADFGLTGEAVAAEIAAWTAARDRDLIGHVRSI